MLKLIIAASLIFGSSAAIAKNHKKPHKKAAHSKIHKKSGHKKAAAAPASDPEPVILPTPPTE